MLLLATGTGATIVHMPAVNALWQTGYGVAILVKIGLLAAAMALAAGNLLRSKPRLLAAREAQEGRSAAGLLRALLGGELVIVTGAVFTAALLSSLAPPPPAFALQNSALATVGPGRVVQTVEHAGYRLQVLVSPNKAAAPDSFALRITHGGAAGERRDGDAGVQPPGDGDAPAALQPAPDRARDVLPLGAGAGDGRQVGAGVPDHPAGRQPVHRPDRRSCRGMTVPERGIRLRLLAALLALAAGVAAVLVAILLVRGVI